MNPSRSGNAKGSLSAGAGTGVLPEPVGPVGHSDAAGRGERQGSGAVTRDSGQRSEGLGPVLVHVWGPQPIVGHAGEVGWSSFHHLRMDGDTPPSARAGMIDTFNNPKSHYWIFLISTLAGGEGMCTRRSDISDCK
jgi:hypothetical protein